MAKNRCIWCELEDGKIVEMEGPAIGGHYRLLHKGYPPVNSPEGRTKIAELRRNKGVPIETSTESKEIAESGIEFFSNVGEQLYLEIKDSGKRVNKNNIVHHFENGNIDSPNWMNYCLKVGGIQQAHRVEILSTHYGLNGTEIKEIIDKEGDYATTDVKTIPKETSEPYDDIYELAKKDMEIAKIQHAASWYRKGALPPEGSIPKGPSKPIDDVYELTKKDMEIAQMQRYADSCRQGTPGQQQSKPGDDGKDLVEIPVRDPYDPQKPLRDSNGKIVVAHVSPNQMMMEQQFSGGRSKNDGDIANNPAFVALKDQMTGVLEENKALREEQRLGAMENRIMQRIDQVEAKTQSEVGLWKHMTDILRSEGILPQGRGLFQMGGSPEETMSLQTIGFLEKRADNISKQVDKFGTLISSDMRQKLLEARGGKTGKRTALPDLEDSAYAAVMKEIEDSEGMVQESLEEK